MEQQPAEKQTPLEDGDSEQNDLPLIDLESAGQRAPSRRKRAAQIGLALLAAAMVLVTFRGGLSPRKPRPRSRPRRPCCW